jgi:hypothetical protein
LRLEPKGFLKQIFQFFLCDLSNLTVLSRRTSAYLTTTEDDHATENPVKIGVKIVGRVCYVTFRLAEVAVPRDLFPKFQRRIDDLRPGAVAA